MTEIKLWCYVTGVPNYFQVSILSSQIIDDLKRTIRAARENTLRCDAADLNLTKVDANLDDPAVDTAIADGRYRPNPNANPIKLKPRCNISDIWPLQPSYEHLHVFVSLRVGAASPIIVYDGAVPEVDLLRDYRDLFVKVENWGAFQYSDLERNRIELLETIIPDFVTTFEEMLARPPRLPVLMREGLQMLGVSVSCFEHSEGSIAEDESHQTRCAELSEAIHTAHLVQFYKWERTWGPVGGVKNPLKGHASRIVLFDLVDYAPKNRTVATQQDKPWPMTTIVQRDDENFRDEKPRKYRPRSDFLISNSCLPRLLVEVNSTRGVHWPKDLIRMLTTGAFIVRFANRFVSAFNQRKDFVLCAIFIWDGGSASRFTLFQIGDNEMVYYNNETLSLNSSAERVVVLHHLYNLHCVELDEEEEQGTKSVIETLNQSVNECRLKSLYTKECPNKRARTGDGPSAREDGGGHASEGSGNDDSQLRAHGFEVKPEPEVIVDDSGGIWEPIYEMPDHILTVYRPMDPNKEFIAKKVREGSNELEMFRLLDAIPVKSDHLICLVDSFHGWAILPKMITVQDYVQFALDQDKVSEVCLALVNGLVKGVAYLHEHGIAHRDIKPDNLVVDESFCLKIIDFDFAMRVEDEDEEVDDQCGTQDWMAPEVVKKWRHSPIRADRWACGRVLLFLHGKFGHGQEDIFLRLRGFASILMARNPKERPSLLEWYSYSAPPFSDANSRKVEHPRPDPVEVDGENAKPPNVKKQRLDGLGLGHDMSGFRYDLGHMAAVH